MIPAPGTPPYLGITVPDSVVRDRACGREYQEGASTTSTVCQCGTFAVGLCTECGAPACGLHSEMWQDRRVCIADAKRLAREREKADDARKAEERARRLERESRQARGERERLVSVLRSIDDPDDRFVAARCLRAQWSSGKPSGKALDQLFAGVSFRFFASAEGFGWRWNSAEVMAWAAARGKSRRRQIAVHENRKRWYSSIPRTTTIGLFDGWKIGDRTFDTFQRGDPVTVSWPLYATTNGMVIEVRETNPLSGHVDYEGSRLLRATDLPNLAQSVGLRVPGPRLP